MRAPRYFQNLDCTYVFNIHFFHWQSARMDFDDDDSVGPPPPPPKRGPPPPSPPPKGEFQEQALTRDDDDDEEDEGRDMFDEETFAIPPPPPVEGVPLEEDDSSVEMDISSMKHETPPKEMDDDEEEEEYVDRKMLYAGICCCILVILAIVLGVGYGTGSFGSSAPAPAPGSAPGSAPPPTPGVDVDDSDTERVTLFNDYLSTVVVDPAALSDETSAEYLSLRYMANNDPAMLDPNDTSEENLMRINQRYALLTLYFASEEDQWVSGENWLNEDECSWFGVTCGGDAGNATADAGNATADEEADGNRRLQTMTVTGIVMVDNGMFGPISADLSLLVKLTDLVLAGNQLSGVLSDFDFSPLASLVTLDLMNNTLEGQIAESLYSLENLETLVLDNNMLTGTISPLIANLQNLVRFTAGDNRLTGAVIAEFGDMPNLRT
jgi:hypothetical protein